MIRTAHVGLAIALVSCGAVPVAWGESIYNLSSDWSNSSNPNGVWAYRQGTTVLPHRSNLDNVDPWSTPQQAWGADRIPVWFKSNGTERFAHDWLAGDVITHTGEGGGEANILWTSPSNGTIDIDLTLWDGRDLDFRDKDWQLFHNSLLIAGGDVSGTRASPFTTAATDIAVSLGDTITLFIFKDPGTTLGDYAGLDLTVTLEGAPPVVPLPSAAYAGSALLAGIGAASARRRRAPPALP